MARSPGIAATLVSGVIAVLFNIYFMESTPTNYQRVVIYCLIWLVVYSIFKEEI